MNNDPKTVILFNNFSWATSHNFFIMQKSKFTEMHNICWKYLPVILFWRIPFWSSKIWWQNSTEEKIKNLVHILVMTVRKMVNSMSHCCTQDRYCICVESRYFGYYVPVGLCMYRSTKVQTSGLLFQRKYIQRLYHDRLIWVKFWCIFT